MNRNDSGFDFVVKGTTYSLAALMVVRALSIVGSILVARILGRTNLGMLSIVNNITGLAVFFATLGVPTALTKFVAQAAGTDRARLPSIVGTALIAMLIPLLLLSAGLFAAAGPIARGIYHDSGLTPLIRIAAFVLFFNCLGTGAFGQSLLQGLKEVKRVSLINIVASAVNLPVVIALTAIFHLPGALVTQLLVALLGFLLILLGVRKVGLTLSGFRFDAKFLPALMNMAFPAFLSGLVMTPALLITTTRLQNARTFGDVGLFNICLGLFQMILFLPVAVGMPLVPMIAESNVVDPAQMKRRLRIVTELTAFAALVLSTAFGVFARPAIFALYGRGYLDAAPAMTVMASAVFFTSMGTIIGHYFTGTGKMWTGMAFNLLWLVLLIPLAWYLIPARGVVGLAYAFEISYGIMTFGMLIYFSRAIGLPARYLYLLSGIALAGSFVSRKLLSSLQGLEYAAAGMATFAVVVIAGFLLLPSKQELRGTLVSLREWFLRRSAGLSNP